MDSSMVSDRRIHSILLPAACLLPIVLISPFSYNLQDADFGTKKAPSSESAGFSLFNYHISYKQHDSKIFPLSQKANIISFRDRSTDLIFSTYLDAFPKMRLQWPLVYPFV